MSGSRFGITNRVFGYRAPSVQLKVLYSEGGDFHGHARRLTSPSRSVVNRNEPSGSMRPAGPTEPPAPSSRSSAPSGAGEPSARTTLPLITQPAPSSRSA